MNNNIDYSIDHLSNGLKIVVHEDHSTPKAVVDLIYKVGAKNEKPNKTGFAHLFEHLMFEGSKHVPSYDKPLQKVGGSNNAFTNQDITNYYINLPANQLETAFWLESDRMLELDFSEEKLQIQKSVVIEEFKQRYLNQPYGDAYLNLLPLHFEQSNYQWPTIGKEIAHIENATLDDVKEFFFGFYAPNNATLVVTGDVYRDRVLNLAEKWFGGIPERQLLKKGLPRETKQTQAKFTTIYGEVPTTAVYKAFHIPAYLENDYFALEIITELLNSGKAGLFYQELIRKKQLTSSSGGFSWMLFDDGFLTFYSLLNPGVSVEDYDSAFEEVLNLIQNTTEEDLQRIKNKIESEYIYGQIKLINRAMSMAIYDAAGKLDIINELLEKYLSVTLDQVKNVANKYLIQENSSTLYYKPKQ